MTLLPSIPLLKRLDEWFLSTFLEWGEIPAEVKRRAAAMTPESFTVSREDVAALRQTYGAGSYGDSLSRYLRRRGADGPELSHCRLTRVVKLYDRVRRSISITPTRSANARPVPRGDTAPVVTGIIGPWPDASATTPS